jgi:hemin uptake protein HemP
MARTRLNAEKAPAPHGGSAQPKSGLLDRHSCQSAARRWRSSELFGPTHEIEIEHGKSVYRLRLTSLGKLILTK